MTKPFQLSNKTTFKIKPTKPFAFDSTFHKPDHFTSGDNYWEPGKKWQTMNWKGERIGLKFVNIGSIEDPLVEISIFSNKKLEVDLTTLIIEEIKYLYNFNLELDDFYKAFKKDKLLSPIIEKWRGMRPGHPSSLYEYIIIGIVLQNASVKRSIQMFKTLIERYGSLVEFDSKQLWCFWNPGGLNKVTEEELRLLKVGYRARSIKRIDESFSKGVINETDLREKDREIQMSELLKLYGVGPATVWYLLFDVFHHWDFFNHISPWEQKIYSKLFFNHETTDPVSVERLLKYFERYGKYKQLAVHYIWEDLFWKRENESIPWLEKEIRR